MNCLSYRIALHKLDRRRNRVSKSIKKLVEEARKKGGEAKAQEVNAVESDVIEEIDHKILSLRTQYLTGKATKRFLDTPEYSNEELWEYCNFIGGGYHLTDKGIVEMMKVIRTYRKERLETWAKWVSVLIGIIGAVTFLVAVMKR